MNELDVFKHVTTLVVALKDALSLSPITQGRATLIFSDVRGRRQKLKGG